MAKKRGSGKSTEAGRKGWADILRRGARGGPGGGSRPAATDRLVNFRPLTWLVLVLVCLLAFVSMFNMIELGDEGIICTGAWRITRGEIPYRDFFEIIPPVTFYVVAIFFKALGPSILAGRLVTFLTAIGLALLTLRLSKNLKLPPLFGALAGSVFLVGGVSGWPFPSHHWLANLGLMASLLCLLEAIDRESIPLSAASGLLAGLTGLTLQDQGGYWVIGAALLSFPFLPSGGRRRLALAWLSACAGVAAIAALLLLTKVSAHTLWYDLVIFPLTRYKAQEGNVSEVAKVYGPILELWNSGKGASFPMTFALTAASNLVLFLSIPGSLLILLWGMFKESGQRAKLGAIMAACLAMGLTAMHRLSLLNTFWGSAVPFLALGWGLSTWTSRAPSTRKWIPRSLALILLAINLWLGSTLLYKMASLPSHKVVTPAGTMRTTKEVNARLIGDLVKAIYETVPAGDPIFCNGYVPMVYFITKHPNPTRYNILIAYNTPEQVTDAISNIESKRVPWVVTRRTDLAEGPLLDYLDRNYDPVWNNEIFLLCKRRVQPLQPPK